MQSVMTASGTADSFLKVSHVTRTRPTPHITACIYRLMIMAYSEENHTNEHTLMKVETWCAKASSPQFKLWSLILKLRLTTLTFVKAIREANFHLYVDALTEIVPWFFALDHPNYASELDTCAPL